MDIDGDCKAHSHIRICGFGGKESSENDHQMTKQHTQNGLYDAFGLQ